jgi:hypothetical protein
MIGANRIRDDHGVARKEKARHGMPGLGRSKDKKVRAGRSPTSRRLFCRNNVRPFVVGLGVSFVLAGREELR